MIVTDIKRERGVIMKSIDEFTQEEKLDILGGTGGTSADSGWFNCWFDSCKESCRESCKDGCKESSKTGGNAGQIGHK